MLQKDGMEDYLLSNDIFTTDQLVTLKIILKPETLSRSIKLWVNGVLNDIDNKKLMK